MRILADLDLAVATPWAWHYTSPSRRSSARVRPPATITRLPAHCHLLGDRRRLGRLGPPEHARYSTEHRLALHEARLAVRAATGTARRPGASTGDAGPRTSLVTSPGRGDCAGVRKAAAQCPACRRPRATAAASSASMRMVARLVRAAFEETQAPAPHPHRRCAAPSCPSDDLLLLVSFAHQITK